MEAPQKEPLHLLQILHWPQIAAELDITMTECQSFLRYFREQPGYFTTEPTCKVPHGTLVKWTSLQEVVNELHGDGGVMPIEVQLIWGHLTEIVDPQTIYVWCWNWNNNGPR
jgi:hypothetical protein